MPTYIAMLRGINVSGHKPVKMDRLRGAFEAIGHTAVQTYVQSGNVVFTTASKSDTDLAAAIEKTIMGEFGFAVPVVIRNAKEMDGVLKQNPWVRREGIDEKRLFVTFLSQSAPPTADAALKPLVTQAEEYFIRDREIYVFCPKGYGETKLSNAAIEKKLGLSATSRNWRTVNILAGMARS